LIDWGDYDAHFRGSYQTIRERLQQHAYHLSRISAVENRGLDLGCGRGEWLEICKEFNVNVTGVDQSASLIGDLSRKGFDVVCSNASDYLNSQPDESFHIVSSFHMLEHLVLGDVFELLRQVFRILTPGGLFVAETPNTLNLHVVTSTFWIDPTHIRPIHPEQFRYLLNDAGFTDITFTYLNPLHSKVAITGLNQLDHILQAYFGPQDLGIYAQRPL
jgi:2-polyprenyl-3-methyl-5-hydroxy-6-metoxy-1,4-benzoquinol methylase